MPKGNNTRKKEPVYIGEHLEMHPGIHQGALIFRGTRVRVKVVFAYLAKGYSVEWATEAWPDVPREAILEAIELAGNALEEQLKEAA
jgi:uncharacterized protein (DUF433 family)